MRDQKKLRWPAKTRFLRRKLNGLPMVFFSKILDRVFLASLRECTLKAFILFNLGES